MTPRQIWTLVAGTAAAGLGIGYAIGSVVTDNRLAAEYQESARSYRRAMDMTRSVNLDESPVESEAELAVDASGTHVEVFDINKVSFKPAQANPYHVAPIIPDEPVGVVPDGQPNEHGIAYIEEDDFAEADGRFKGLITIVMDPREPTFFMDGQMIDDWANRLGPNIVADFRAMVPTGILNPTLYVRNFNTDEDYEVTPEHP